MPPPYTSQTTASEHVADLSDLISSKTVLITGVSPNGLGSAFAHAIAKASPRLLILAGRNLTRTRETADAITAQFSDVQTRVLQLDLGSLRAVRDAAATVNSWDDVPAIDVLVNNAGIMAVEYGLSVDGVEQQFATNHLGHFLLTNLIMGKLLKAEGPRVVSVSSDGHRFGGVRFDDLGFDEGKTYNKWVAYGQSKTANMLMALSLAKKLGSKGLLAFSVHPGVIQTNIGSNMDSASDVELLRATDRALGNKEGWRKDIEFKTQEQGVATTVFAAFSPDLKANNGAYLKDSHVADPWTETVKPWATCPVEAERLWKLSEKLVGQEFEY